MHGLQNIYFAMGEVAYAIAKADGVVQKEERKIVHDIMLEEIDHKHFDFDFAETIFLILEKDDPDSETSYQWALKEFEENSLHLTPELIDQFIVIADRVAEAFDMPSDREDALVARFKKDIRQFL